MPRGIPNSGINKGWFKKGNTSPNKGRKFPDRLGENSPSWKGGKAKCIDCSIRLSSYTSKRCLKCFIKNRVGINHPMYGVHRYGKNAPNYKKSAHLTPKNKRIRMSKKYDLWRNKIFKRDKWTCLECKIIGGNIQAHHILSFSKFPKLRFDIKNGITLCIPCHKKVHKNGRN